jgi:hypothetical protein
VVGVNPMLSVMLLAATPPPIVKMPFANAAVTLVAVTRFPSILKLSEDPDVVGAGVVLPVLGADGVVLLPPHAPAITLSAIPARTHIILFMTNFSTAICETDDGTA